jgi:hypothetical protein
MLPILNGGTVLLILGLVTVCFPLVADGKCFNR